MMNSNAKLIYPRMSYNVVGCCMKVHNEYGRFCREKQYSDYLEEILKSKQIKYKKEVTIFDTKNRADFIVDNRIIVELKAKKIITRDDMEQVQRYLQATQLKLGLLINFGSELLYRKRILLIETDARKKFQ